MNDTGNLFDTFDFQSTTQTSVDKKKIGAGILALVIIIGIALALYFLVYKPDQDKKKLKVLVKKNNDQTNAPAPHDESDHENVYSSETPDLDTIPVGTQSLHDVNGVPSDGPEPIEAEYGSANTSAEGANWGAPVDTASSNDALSMANPDNALWRSPDLLPNASLQCGNDGMITDGPTYEELAIFTPRLLEASVASRWFMDPPTISRPCGSDLRPTPLISATAGSRDNLTWSVSSIQQSDLALQNAGKQRVWSV